jgi:hypothetical protein
MALNRTPNGQGSDTLEKDVAPDGRERPRESNGAPAVEQPSPAMQRAEELVDRMAERVGHYTGVIGHKILWFMARAREEAEDIWAEAQALRQKKRQESAGTSDDYSV